MSRSFMHSRPARLLVLVLIAAIVATSVPVTAQAPTVSSPLASDPDVRANRNKPRVDGPADRLVLPTRPSSADIFAARVFPEPLIPVGGEPTDDENAALGRALRTFYARPDRSAAGALTSFLDSYPTSVWRPSLLANLGSLYRRSGAFSRALDAFDQSWRLTKDSAEPSAQAVADYAISSWLEVVASFGQSETVQTRLEEIGARNVRGSAATRLSQARETAFLLRTYPDQVIASGPEALRVILDEQGLLGETVPAPLSSYKPTAAGTSLAELDVLADALGLGFRAARWNGQGPIPVPSVFHWKLGHFSPIVERQGDRYRIVDVALGGMFWVSAATLGEEGSGHFLIPTGGASGPWSPVTEAESGTVVGHSCVAGGPPPPPPPPPGCSPTAKKPKKKKRRNPGMCGYLLEPKSVSVQLVDTPLSYSPALGPDVEFVLSYQQHELFQPQTFAYANVGRMWSFEWQRFLQEDPGYCITVCIAAHVWLYEAGSRELYFDPNSDGTYDPNWQSRATVVRVSSSPVRYERRFPDGSIEVYAIPDGAAAGERRIFISQMIDPQGQSIAFTWDAQARVIAVTDAIGQVTELAYDHPTDSRRITSVTDPFGRVATLQYTADGVLSSITDTIGITSSFTYGYGDFVASMTTPYGTTTFRHEANPDDAWWARMVEATDPLGETEHLHYEWLTTAVPATLPASEVPTGFEGKNGVINHYNTFYWNKQAWKAAPGDKSKAVITRRLLMSEHPQTKKMVTVPHSVKLPLEGRVWYDYPGQGASSNVVGWFEEPSTIGRKLDDGSSQIWQYTYDSFGNVLTATDPLGRRTSYTYASNGVDLLTIRQTTGSENQLLASFSNYTAQHVPQTIVDAAGRTTSVTYNSAGQPLTITNAKSEVTTLAYDTDGQLESVDGPGTGDTSTFTYDGYGRLRTLTTPEGYSTTTDYDLFDRVTKVTYPDGSYDGYTYDRLDLSSVRDRLGRVTRFYYTARRELAGTRDPLGRTVQQIWGPDGTLDRLLDGKRQATSWEYDVQGRSTREVRADNSDTTYTYEAIGGRLKTVTDPEDQVKTYTYFLDDAMASVAYTNANTATPSVSYTYDPIYGRVSTMVDGLGTTTYTYHPVGVDGAGQVSTVDGARANDTLIYVYDELGRVTNRALNAVGVAWVYDTLGRVTSETNPVGAFAYTYDGVTARPATTTYPNGQTTTYSYYGNTGDRRLQTLHHKLSGGATLSKFDYAYDKVGNILSWQQQADAAAPTQWSYAYDIADQLLSALKKTTDPTPTLLARFHYSYDAAGNRTSEQIGNNVSGVAVNALNRLVSQQPAGQLHVGGSLNEPGTVTVNGRATVADASNAFSARVPVQSGANALTVVAKDGSGNTRTQIYDLDSTGANNTFTHDANGNMTSDGNRSFEWDAENRLVAINIGTHRSEFTYDGWNRRTRVVEKESGVTIRDASLFWAEGSIAEERVSAGAVNRFFSDAESHDSVSKFVTRDHLGSVREVTDASGSILTRNEFDPFGRISRVSGSEDSRFGFAGLMAHTPSGLALAVYRAYDSQQGRWISDDPIGLAGGLNLYAYAAANPVRFVDPAGLNPAVLAIQGAQVGSLAGPAGTIAGAVIGAAIGYLIFTTVKDVYGGRNLPWRGEPNTTVRGDKQTRRYGPDGYPDVDVDLPHPGHKPDTPHAHDITRPKDGSPPKGGKGQDRGEPRDIRPDDPPMPRGGPQNPTAPGGGGPKNPNSTGGPKSSPTGGPKSTPNNTPRC
jgi:RHS repeat-associated protein